MTEVHRLVVLPDGREVVEVEVQHIGGSETQVHYEYRKVSRAESIDVSKLKRDRYAGKVLNVKYV